MRRTKMNIWNENYIVKIAVKIDDCDTEEQAIETMSISADSKTP